MLVERAGVARTQRYDRWYGLLVEELDLVAMSGTGIFAVGNAVAQHLERRAFPRPFTKVIHYSGLAQLRHEEDRDWDKTFGFSSGSRKVCTTFSVQIETFG